MPRKKGRLEKKYWDQIVAMCPYLRRMVTAYEEHFGAVEGEIEAGLASIEEYLERPRQCGESRYIVSEVAKHFLEAGARRFYPQADPMEAKAFIFSRVSNASLVTILSGGLYGGEHRE